MEPIHSRRFLALSAAAALAGAAFSQSTTAQAPTGERPTVKGAVALVEEVNAALAGIKDSKSAEQAGPALKRWKNSIFLSKKEADLKWLREQFQGSAELRGAIEGQQEQFRRIREIDRELFEKVFVAMVGRSPFNPVESLSKLVELMEGIEKEADFLRLEGELEKWGHPFFAVFDRDFEGFLEFLTGNPSIRGEFAAFQRESNRIGKIDPDLGKKVAVAMMTEEVFDRMEERMDGVRERAAATRTQARLGEIKTAILSYFTEYRKFPVPAGVKIDVEWQADKDLVAILTGKDRALNPRQIRFMTPAEGAMDEKGNLTDAWGRPLRVFLDTDYDNTISPPKEYGPEKVLAPVAVDSAGPDGKFETAGDNLKSWDEAKGGE